MDNKLQSRQKQLAVMNPRLFLLGSMLLSYFVIFLPWVSLTVYPLIAEAPPQQLTQINARFWESQPLIFTGELAEGFSPRCSIGKVEWQAGSIKQIYDWLHGIGWGIVVIELSVWLLGLLMQPKLRRAISCLGFVLVGIVAGIAGVLILALLGPSASCPQLIGVRVEQVTPVWPTLLVALASIGLGIVSVYLSFLRTSTTGLSANLSA